MKSYIFEANAQQEGDGRWSAWIEALPGCTAWGYSREEALKDAADLYIQDMIEEGEELPKEGFRVPHCASPGRTVYPRASGGKW